MPWRLYPSLKIFCCKNSTSLCQRKRNERKYLQGLAKKKKNAVEPTMRSGNRLKKSLFVQTVFCVLIFLTFLKIGDNRSMTEKGGLATRWIVYIVYCINATFFYTNRFSGHTLSYICLFFWKCCKGFQVQEGEVFNVFVFVFVFIFVFVKGFQRRFRKERATACQSCREAQDPHLDLLSQATPVAKRKSSLIFSRQPRRMGAIMKPSC